MKKLCAAIAATLIMAACGDNGNPSGTPSSDSTAGSLSAPDTSANTSITPTDSTTNGPASSTDSSTKIR